MTHRHLLGAALLGASPGSAALCAIPMMWTRENWGMNMLGSVMLSMAFGALCAGVLIVSGLMYFAERRRRAGAVSPGATVAVAVVAAVLALVPPLVLYAVRW